MICSQSIKLIGVDGRFSEIGHVIVDGSGFPEVVTLNGDVFILIGDLPTTPNPSAPIEYRKVYPFRFVRKALP